MNNVERKAYNGRYKNQRKKCKVKNSNINKLKKKRYRRRVRNKIIFKFIMISLFVTILIVIKNNISNYKAEKSKENAKNEIVTTIVDDKSNDNKDTEPKKQERYEKQEEIKKSDPHEIMPNSNVTYEGVTYAMDASDVKAMLYGTYAGSKKYVFLTFDDGPSPNTEKVLDILKENNVKGTFFVLGSMIEASTEAQKTLKRIIKEGNALANHTYTHNLSTLYPRNTIDINYFMEEVNNTNKLMKKILGENFNTKVLRMPGGYMSRKYYNDPSLPAFDDKLNSEGIVSIDWNTLNGDAEGVEYTVEEMVNKVKEGAKEVNQSIVLMHDTYGKEKTVEALPEIINYFKSQGYEFRTIK
ncbi:polysaccharide deacetylase family protein [Clostridium septicum]|uniref:Polysaccharide deacetylase n=1 Tax=Clostridium septicum TaxID=1504 RepID=A0A9N7JIV8_CLOSE|nr:polysaccharide deacetylase family protein [Clostridium septicum]AYE33263.1 polysaccharide deacetylase [Clostridium septicum]QAS61434.1 polysaccharide deacetylase [Clostridium septicum]UEC22133.1 polysaccharide deacetylase [Clostridium septicum]USR99837.1 polysaccharide deacetylase [Clostridium septicum]WLF68357.1 polysaccharide deacetylase family protein [Clostridium septicum]